MAAVQWISTPEVYTDLAEVGDLGALNNYPNPFNENTMIEAVLPENSTGEIVINDVTGKQIKRIALTEMENQYEVKGDELGFGIFFYSLYVNGEYVKTKKMTRTK
jgi:type IX secretion system substrate protein